MELLDVSLFSQVIEHVANPAEFSKSLSELTVDSGATVISTINRSLRAYAATIIAAEYILRWVCGFDPYLLLLPIIP